MIQSTIAPKTRFRSRVLWILLAAGFALFSAAEEKKSELDISEKIWPDAIFHPQTLQASGLQNFFQLSDKVFSGSAPEGDGAFAELKKRGIKTIITVDGAKPDVESAKKFGLRYVHLPIGYDGVPARQAVRLVKAAESLPQPIYVHCHHGMHRGPAGAAVICEAMENWTARQAVDWLRMAGTATNYMGLYKSVAEFHRPSSQELEAVPGDFPDKTEVSPLVDAMVEVDGRFDNLKIIQKAGFQQPLSHPDLNPAHEALLLEELFREINRSAGFQKRKNRDFAAKMIDAENQARELRSILSASPIANEKAEVAFKNIAGSCAACHKEHRN